MPAAAENLDPFSKWTVTEPARPRPLLRKQRLSKSLSAAAVLCHARVKSVADTECQTKSSEDDGCGRGDCVTMGGNSRPCEAEAASDGGYAAFKVRFEKEYKQQHRVSCLAVSRRHRMVAQTLQAVRESWEPDDRLAAAAAAEAEELARLFRTPAAQLASCSDLSRPKVLESVEEPEAPEHMPRSWAQQQARARALAEPRLLPQQPQPPPAPVRSVAQQQRHCSELAQPRAVAAVPGSTAAWREELASRAAAMVPEEVQAARALLATMRSRPRSAPRWRPASVEASAMKDEAVAAQLVELKAMVEEVLWVVLLQVRSCPKPQPLGAGPSGLGATSLEERLGGLLTAQVGPALRPVAKRLLGPGQGLPRRLRAEFPKLARHLGFRESEDQEPLPTVWQREEVCAHLETVRSSRDELLSMDLTKDAILRLADLKLQ